MTELSKNKGCFIIAEAGVNHNGKLSLAKKMVDTAKSAGVDAVKFQTFKVEDLVTQDARSAMYQQKNTGKKESQMVMLKKLELSDGDFKKLKQHCDKKKIMFLSTPHTVESLDFLKSLVPIFKISSADLTNIPLIKKVARFKKPVILSTGMANITEIREAVNVIKKTHAKIILLHCTSNYPTPFDEVNLKAMAAMEKEFNLPVGYSDHTEGIEISLAAVSLGAVVIEKHFTLTRSLQGPDHVSSLEPKELKQMVDQIRNIEKALGDGIKKPFSSELKIAKLARKSIVARENVLKGSKIKEGMLAIKRPGTGIEPKYFYKLIGKEAKVNIKKDQLINWKMVYK